MSNEPQENNLLGQTFGSLLINDKFENPGDLFTNCQCQFWSWQQFVMPVKCFGEWSVRLIPKLEGSAQSVDNTRDNTPLCLCACVYILLSNTNLTWSSAGTETIVS